MKTKHEGDHWMDGKVWPWVVLGGLLVAVGLAWYFVPQCLGPETLKEEDGRGAYGDSFGSINALFTGLAFAGLIFTILLQRRELQLQRLELRDSTTAQEKIALSQRETAKIMARQTASQLIVARIEAIRSAQVIIKQQMDDARNRSSSLAANMAHLERESKTRELTARETEELRRLTQLHSECFDTLSELYHESENMNRNIMTMAREIMIPATHPSEE